MALLSLGLSAKTSSVLSALEQEAAAKRFFGRRCNFGRRKLCQQTLNHNLVIEHYRHQLVDEGIRFGYVLLQALSCRCHPAVLRLLSSPICTLRFSILPHPLCSRPPARFLSLLGPSGQAGR